MKNQSFFSEKRFVFQKPGPEVPVAGLEPNAERTTKRFNSFRTHVDELFGTFEKIGNLEHGGEGIGAYFQHQFKGYMIEARQDFELMDELQCDLMNMKSGKSYRLYIKQGYDLYAGPDGRKAAYEEMWTNGVGEYGAALSKLGIPYHEEKGVDSEIYQRIWQKEEPKNMTDEEKRARELLNYYYKRYKSSTEGMFFIELYDLSKDPGDGPIGEIYSRSENPAEGMKTTLNPKLTLELFRLMKRGASDFYVKKGPVLRRRLEADKAADREGEGKE